MSHPRTPAVIAFQMIGLKLWVKQLWSIHVRLPFFGIHIPNAFQHWCVLCWTSPSKKGRHGGTGNMLCMTNDDLNGNWSLWIKTLAFYYSTCIPDGILQYTCRTVSFNLCTSIDLNQHAYLVSSRIKRARKTRLRARTRWRVRSSFASRQSNGRHVIATGAQHQDLLTCRMAIMAIIWSWCLPPGSWEILRSGCVWK